jgi:uncharacterized protein (DUF1778 family)
MPKKAPSDLKSFILHVRFTTQQRDLLQFAAKHEERELSDWLRRLALKEATRIKEKASQSVAHAIREAEERLTGGGRRRITVGHREK